MVMQNVVKFVLLGVRLCGTVGLLCIQDRQKRAILQPQAAAKPLQATTTLWINGLSTDTKAADLKMLFIKYGKV